MRVCNNQRLITKYTEKLTRVRRSTTDEISPGRGKVKIWLAKKDGSEDLVLILPNIFYLPNSPLNLVSLSLLNDVGIYHHNKDQTLYNQSIQKTFAFAERYKTSFLLHLLNQSSTVVHLPRSHKVYQTSEINHTQSDRLHLTVWYQRLGQLNFTTIKKHLAYHNIDFINDVEEFICDSCKRVKAKKQ